MTIQIEIEREDDGRWIADIPELPGVTVYGCDRKDAIEKVRILALRVMADRLENGESLPHLEEVFAVGA